MSNQKYAFCMALGVFLVFLFLMVANAGSPSWTWDSGDYDKDGTVTMNGETYAVNPTGAQSLNGRSVRQPPTVIVQAASSGGEGLSPFCVEAKGPPLPGYGRIVESSALTCYVPAEIEGITETTVIKGVSTSSTTGYWSAALSYCANLTEGGHTNWTLPTLVELDSLCATKAKIGGFSSDTYWSLNEFDSNHAWIVRFSDGLISTASKPNILPVRCVRH